jgi:hypothetical protein
LILTEPVAAKEPTRVKVTNGTLTTPDGDPLRGATFFVDLGGVSDMRENEAKYHQYFKSIFQDHKLNCVRICPWMGVWKYDLAGNEQHRRDYLYAIDRVVKWSAGSGVYAVVNLHTQYNTKVDLTKAKAFWSVLAPRYKDSTHVIYDLTNEPEPTSSLAVVAELHKFVKSQAPDAHQILFSHVAATQLKPDELKTVTSGVDFSNASIGFHCYDNVLLNTVQWDHAAKLQEAGYPVICTEFISLTNNNDMPISYDHLMHCMMRAEERKMAWISWGPFAQYRNPNKKDWDHKTLRYSLDFTRALIRYGIDFSKGPQWPQNGRFRLQCVETGQYLVRTSDEPWKKVTLAKDTGGKLGVWMFKRFDGNMYRIHGGETDSLCLHGKFEDDQTWQEAVTATANAEWNSQKFQLLRTGKETYQIKCRWGDLYLTSDKSNDEAKTASVRTGPLTHELSQHWRLLPMRD